MALSAFLPWLRRKNPTRSLVGRRFRSTFFYPRLEYLEARTLLSTFTVLNTGEGAASVRQAILTANAHANSGGPDRIEFNIAATDPGHVYYRDDGIAGHVSQANITAATASDDTTFTDIDPDWRHSWWSIRPGTLLPQITDPVVIDCYTQPGASPTTSPVATH